MMKTRGRGMVDNKTDEKNVCGPEIPSENVEKKISTEKTSVRAPSNKQRRGCGKMIEVMQPSIGETVSVHVQKQPCVSLIELKQVGAKSEESLFVSADIKKFESQHSESSGKKDRVSRNKCEDGKSRLLDAHSTVISKRRKRAKPEVLSKLSDTIAHSITVKSECAEEETQPVIEVKKRKKSLESIPSMKSENALSVPFHVATGKKFVGAHVSIAGGLWNAVLSTQKMGGKAFGMFLKSQRTWKSKPLESTEAALFKKTLLESGISPWMVVPHGSYLMNCGSSDDEVLRKSRENLIDELDRCEQLGLPIYNLHPGSSKGLTSRTECIEKIAESINYVHTKTTSVITVIENMSGQGNTIGGSFAELRGIIDLVHDKSRIGVCLDTCHAFAAGYDMTSEDGYEQMKTEFDTVVGHEYLKAIHLNDSKGELGCNLDRHENIGKGKLGLATFTRMMRDPFFDDVPMILETPECDYSREIRILYEQQSKK